MLVLKVIFGEKAFLKTIFMLFLFLWIFRSIIPTKSLKLDFPLPLLHYLHIMWFSSDLTTATFRHMLQKIWHPILQVVIRHLFSPLYKTSYLRTYFSLLGGWQRLSTWEQPVRHHFRSF